MVSTLDCHGLGNHSRHILKLWFCGQGSEWKAPANFRGRMSKGCHLEFGG